MEEKAKAAAKEEAESKPKRKRSRSKSKPETKTVEESAEDVAELKKATQDLLDATEEVKGE